MGRGEGGLSPAGAWPDSHLDGVVKRLNSGHVLRIGVYPRCGGELERSIQRTRPAIPSLGHGEEAAHPVPTRNRVSGPIPDLIVIRELQG